MGAAQSSFRGKIYVDGKLYASAQFGLEVLKDGRIRGHIDYILTDRSYSQASSFDCDKLGRILDQTIAESGRRKSFKEVTYGPQGAAIRGVDGSSKPVFLAYPKGVQLGAPSRLWFIRFQPKVGASCRYTVLQTAQLIWQTAEAKYVGDAKLKYLGKTVTAHKVKWGDAVGWFDDRGVLFKHKGSEGLLVRDGVADPLK